MKDKLPKSWEVTTLAAICEKVKVVKRKEQDPYDSFYYLDIGGINNSTNRIEAHKTYLWKDAPSRAQQIVRKNDILFSTVRTYLKNIAFIDSDKFNDQIASSGFTVIRANRLSHYKYLFYYSISQQFLRPLNELQTGSSYPAVRDKDVFAQPVPLPPIDEQKRIVAKIEELFSELDAGVESLKKAQAQLKTYRQAVLKSAFEGNLTNKNVSNDELPEGWKLVKLADVATSRLGKMLDRTKNVGDLQPYLRNINVRWGNFDLSDLYEMRFEKNEAEKYGLERGDLVICEGGEPGRAAIWKESGSPMKIQKALHRVRFSSAATPTYFMYFLFYSAKTKKLEKHFTGTTIKHLTGESLKQIEFPFPSVAEQQRIVEEIESRLSVCDKLEETIAASLKQSEALRQSILKRAFEGKLL